MQKRINEIKQQDRKSYYEIANEIGISESTLYSLMSKGKLFTPAEQKITAYLKGYLTKDEKLEAYRLDNEELKAENEQLKEEIKEVKKYQYEQEYLEKEIETAKVNLDISKEEARHYLHEAYKFQKCLQEIKEYINSQGIDNSWNMRIQRFRMGILDLITKAEEKWK